MGKEKTVASMSFLQELFQFGVYKKTQGRVARQVTFAVLAVTFAFGAWRLLQFLVTFPELADGYRYLAAGLVLLVGQWFSYRVVNYPRFADFLISVEAELHKVSWPTRGVLWRSAVVVIVVIFVLAVVLYAYDVLWVTVFTRVLGILG